MKKILSICFILTAVLLFSSSAMADNGAPDGSSIGGTVFKTSSNVTLIATSSTVAYGVAAKHVNGDKGYSSADTSSEITAADDIAKGQIPTAVTVTGTPTWGAASS
ncbi:MAG: hypothetical protein KAT62_10975 [Desulfuromonadales bacterium]|nr:hypothetical protein [Desulfuromonadales bacterium]